MKLKATRKTITTNFSKIYLIKCKYGFLPDAFAYNSGHLGWNWDAYDLGGNVCLIKGYRNFPKCKRLPKSAQKIVDEYERKVDATFNEIEELNKKYLDMFKELLIND